MRRAVVLLVALTSSVPGAIAACGSGSNSNGSTDASLPADGPLAIDGYAAAEGGADADATTAGEGGPIEAGDGGPDAPGGEDASDTAGDAGDAEARVGDSATDASVGDEAAEARGGTDAPPEASDASAVSDALSSLCPTGCSDAGDAACATPDVAGNPPTPAGYQLLPQPQVTSAMTTWAVDILHDPSTYPMFSCTIETFGSLTVLARVEWLPPDALTSVVHRGVVLFESGD